MNIQNKERKERKNRSGGKKYIKLITKFSKTEALNIVKNHFLVISMQQIK